MPSCRSSENSSGSPSPGAKHRFGLTAEERRAPIGYPGFLRISTAKSHSQEQHRSGRLRFQPDAVIHRILQALLTAKITLSRLDGHVPEQELYLFELPACLVT